MANVHNIQELAVPLKESIEEVTPLPEKYKYEALVPGKPLVKDQEISGQSKRNWPHNYIPEES